MMCAASIVGTPAFAAAPTLPSGFVVQRLAETDGSVWRPKDWFFTSQGTQSGWMWTVSKENPATEPYRTGMRIQLLVGVTSGAGKPPESFAKDFIRNKMRNSEVLRQCAVDDNGEFYRQCLEVLEDLPPPVSPGKYRVLYSVYWGKKMDMVVISTFGAPQSSWGQVAPIVDTMSRIELFGPNFGK